MEFGKAQLSHQHNIVTRRWPVIAPQSVTESRTEDGRNHCSYQTPTVSALPSDVCKFQPFYALNSNPCRKSIGVTTKTDKMSSAAKFQRNRFKHSYFKKKNLRDVSGTLSGSQLQGPKTGNLGNFSRAESKPLELEIYLLNRNSSAP